MRLSLEERLARYGLPLFSAEGGQEFTSVLKDAFRSGDTRFLEGLPVVAAHFLSERDAALPQVTEAFRSKEERGDFFRLLALTTLLMERWAPQPILTLTLNSFLNHQFSTGFSDLRDKFSKGEPMALAGKRLDPRRLDTVFQRYFVKNSPASTHSEVRQKLRAEFDFEFHLSQLFSPKQKELLKKKAHGDPMTKTEREYFSRVVKKKVLAYMDPEVRSLLLRALG